jgi:hypothetical protein
MVCRDALLLRLDIEGIDVDLGSLQPFARMLTITILLVQHAMADLELLLDTRPFEDRVRCLVA